MNTEFKTIEKKTLPEYFKAVDNGDKTFELRKDEDNVQVGDVLVLREYNGTEYTGKSLHKKVTYVLRNAERFGLLPGHCIIGLTDFVRERGQYSTLEQER